MREPMAITVRKLTSADVDWAAAVLAATGLRARQPELRRYLGLEPGGYYAAEEGARPVGLGGYAAYADLAFVGNMAVAPEMQGRGVGRAILTHMLEAIDRRGIPTTLLEATPEGEPLYRKCGFVDEHRTLAYSGSDALRPGEGPAPGAKMTVRTLAEADLDAVAAFDRPRFGGARRHVLARLLQEFPGRGRVGERADGGMAGYLIAQPQILGPWMAEDAAAAEALLAAALGLPFDGPPVAYAPEANAGAAALLPRFGFTPHPESLRMRRGGPGPVGRPECLYGLAALAIG